MGTEKLLKQYPAKGEMAWPLNYELSQLLVWLTNPEIAKVTAAEGARGESGATTDAAREVIKRTLGLLAAAPTQEEQIWYARVLADAAGIAWTKEQREAYWKWWHQAASYQGGNSFGKFLESVRERALARCTPEERTAAEAIYAQPPKPKYIPPARPFVKAWTMQDLAPSLAEVGGKRDLARGKKLYVDGQCALCHKFKGEGGDIGPDLTAASSRYNRHDLLEAIIDPNKGVSEQYAVYRVHQFDDKNEATGMIIGENNTEMQVLTDPLQGTIARINLYMPAEKTLLPISFMPPGLLNSFSKEEIFDLLAYIESGTK
jgi:putative heme-binding domain-containing protein